MSTGTPKRIIRIFISSTFRDFKEERDVLAKTVFADLRAYCEARGFSFHPIDLRWGVPYEDSSRNAAVRICMEEIDRCKSLSPDINFLIMAGDCYGWQPLPEQIDKAVFEKITGSLDPQSRAGRLLRIYYRQDRNDLSLPYCLMPRPIIAAQLREMKENPDGEVCQRTDHQNDPDKKANTFEDADQKEDDNPDEAVRQLLCDLLEKAGPFQAKPAGTMPAGTVSTGSASAEAVSKGKTSSGSASAGAGSDADIWSRLQWQFNASATEQEIFRGYFDESNPSKYNTFILLKGEAPHTPAAPGQTPWHSEASSRAAELRRKLQETVSERHKFQIYEKKDESDTGWIAAVRKFLQAAVDAQIAHYEQLDQWGWEKEILRETYEEVNSHYIELLAAKQAEEFITTPAAHPVLVTGGPGSGKSWFLKHEASLLEKDSLVAAVFNDVEPQGRSFPAALEMLVRALYASRTPQEEGEPDGSPAQEENRTGVDPDDPVQWFADKLNSFAQNMSGGQNTGESGRGNAHRHGQNNTRENDPDHRWGTPNRKTSDGGPARHIVLILDSINGANMPDYASTQGRSLFGLELPPGMQMIVSAVSKADLREADKKEKPQVFNMPPLSFRDRSSLLYQILEKNGRTLTESAASPQRPVVESVLQLSPELDRPLGIEILAQYLMTFHSWDVLPFAGRLDFSALVGAALFRQNRDDYRQLRSHALGYLALSSIGLSEPEIIDLLSADEEVVREIRSQTRKNKAAWDFEGAIPTVLWASLYAELRPYLLEINDEGMILLQLRHTLLRAEILRQLGEVQQRKLLCQLRAYDRGKHWLLYHGTHVLPNRRKVQECFPIYEKLHDTKALTAFLREPACVDAFVRAGFRSEIRGYLGKYGTDRLSSQMLFVLQTKDLLLRLWPDGFVPALAGLLDAEERQDQKKHQDSRKNPYDFPSAEGHAGYHDFQPAEDRAGYDGFRSAEARTDDEGFFTENPSGSTVDRGRLREFLLSAGKHYYMEGNIVSGKGTFFPELYGRGEYALRADGYVAVLMNGVLRIIDMNRKELLPLHAPGVQEDCFLYWQQDILTMRCEKKRLRYSFRNGQVTREEEENAPDWGKLLPRNRDTIPASGGWIEAEHFGFGADLEMGVAHYYAHGQLRDQHIYETYHAKMRGKFHGELAAIVRDARDLLVVNLTDRTILYEEVIYGITNVEWAEDGRQLLVVTRGNTLRLFAVDPSHVIGDMARPGEDYLTYKIVNEGGQLAAYTGRMVHSLYVQNSNACTAPEGYSSETPVFGALSRKYGWTACYFYTDTGAMIRVREEPPKSGNGRGSGTGNPSENPFGARQQGGRERATAGQAGAGKARGFRIENVSEITWQDCKADPFYAAAGENALVLMADGRPVVYDLQRKSSRKLSPKAIAASSLARRQPDEKGEAIRHAYADFMAKALHLRTSDPAQPQDADDIGEDQEQGQERSTRGGFFGRNRSARRGFFGNRTRTAQKTEDIRSTLPYRKLLYADVLYVDGPYTAMPHADAPHTDMRYATMSHADIPHAGVPSADMCYADARKAGAGVYWLIDRDNGLIHAFDDNGHCLCRDMTASSILAADIDPDDGRLYLLLRTRDIISISLLSTEHEPA